MPFDRRPRFPFAAPRLATPRLASHNDLLAERERLAREEKIAAERLDRLRGQLDEVSNKLGAPAPGATVRESEKDLALWAVNFDRSQRGLPPLAKLEPGPVQPKAQKIDPIKTAKGIISAGRRARGEPDDD